MSKDLDDLRRRSGLHEASRDYYRAFDSNQPGPPGSLGSNPEDELRQQAQAQSRVAIKRRARKILMDAGIDLSEYGLDIR